MCGERQLFFIQLCSVTGVYKLNWSIMAPHSSTFAWKIPWMEEPGGPQSMESLRVGHDWATSLSLFTCLHWRRKWQPTPVAWRIPGTGEPGGLPSMGLHRVGHDWSDLAAAAAGAAGSSVHRILQARILEWISIPFCRGSSRPRDQTLVSCITGRFFTVWATGNSEIMFRPTC